MPNARRLLVLVSAFAIALLAVPALASAEVVLTPETTRLELPDTDVHEEEHSSTVKISNEGDATAEIYELQVEGSSDISVDVGNTDCQARSLGPGESCGVRVIADPSIVGEVEATVTVHYDEGEASGAASFTVTCHGRTGTLEAQAPSFDSQPYFYGSQEQQVQVVDNSFWKARIEGLSITGPDASAFNVAQSCPVPSLVFPFQTCFLQVQFSPKAAGEYEASLEIQNDGTVAPLVVLLEATALRGPEVSIAPAEGVDFGPVKIGDATTPRQLTIENSGDFPLVVQQLLVISGTPAYFPLSGSTCAGEVLMPTQTCEFSVGFEPGRSGEKSASVFVISNSGGSVTTAPIVGEGLYAPEGTVSLSTQAKAGVPIYCFVHGFHEYDELTYSWFREGDEIPGETESVYIPTAADVGSAVSCRIEAENGVGTQSVTSDPSATIVAAEVGPEGPAGQQGAQGAAGAVGATGATGPKGPKGPKGQRGPKGPKGDRGPRGPRAKKHKKHHHRSKKHHA